MLLGMLWQIWMKPWPAHATLTAGEGLREPHAPAQLPTSAPEAVEMCQWLENCKKV